MKPKIAIAPRKPVSEAAARQLEERLERKSDGVAGAATAPDLELVTATTPAPPTASAEGRNAARGRKTVHAIPTTGTGTRANPRVRKVDGVKTRSTSIHLPVDLALELTLHCARNGLRQSEVVTRAVREWLSRKD
jgi:hypothetical protein